MSKPTTLSEAQDRKRKAIITIEQRCGQSTSYISNLMRMNVETLEWVAAGFKPDPILPAPPKTPEEIRTACARIIQLDGNWIQAVKSYREWTGHDLKTSKEYIDALREELRQGGV